MPASLPTRPVPRIPRPRWCPQWSGSSPWPPPGWPGTAVPAGRRRRAVLYAAQSRPAHRGPHRRPPRPGRGAAGRRRQPGGPVARQAVTLDADRASFSEADLVEAQQRLRRLARTFELRYAAAGPGEWDAPRKAGPAPDRRAPGGPLVRSRLGTCPAVDLSSRTCVLWAPDTPAWRAVATIRWSSGVPESATCATSASSCRGRS